MTYLESHFSPWVKQIGDGAIVVRALWENTFDIEMKYVHELLEYHWHKGCCAFFYLRMLGVEGQRKYTTPSVSDRCALRPDANRSLCHLMQDEYN